MTKLSCICKNHTLTYSSDGKKIYNWQTMEIEDETSRKTAQREGRIFGGKLWHMHISRDVAIQ